MGASKISYTSWILHVKKHSTGGFMKKRDKEPDVLVIGAGITGLSLAYELAQRNVRVCVVEMEDNPGYHATGRSAATFVNCYGNDIIEKVNLVDSSYGEKSTGQRVFSRL